MAAPSVHVLILSRRSLEAPKTSPERHRGRVPTDDLSHLIDQIDEDMEELKRKRARTYFGLDLSHFDLKTVIHPKEVVPALGAARVDFVFFYRIEGLSEALPAILAMRSRLAFPPLLVVAYNDQPNKGGKWVEWTRAERYLAPKDPGREERSLDHQLRQLYLLLADTPGVVLTSILQVEALLQLSLHLRQDLEGFRKLPPIVYEPEGEVLLPDDALKIPRKLFDPNAPFLDARELALKSGLVEGGVFDRARGLFKKR